MLRDYRCSLQLKLLPNDYRSFLSSYAKVIIYLCPLKPKSLHQNRVPQNVQNFRTNCWGRRTQCGWEVSQDRLLSYEDYRRRVQAEGVDDLDLCGQCGTKPLPIL